MAFCGSLEEESGTAWQVMGPMGQGVHEVHQPSPVVVAAALQDDVVPLRLDVEDLWSLVEVAWILVSVL